MRISLKMSFSIFSEKKSVSRLCIEYQENNGIISHDNWGSLSPCEL